MEISTDRVVVQFVADTSQLSAAIGNIERQARRVAQAGARAGARAGGQAGAREAGGVPKFDRRAANQWLRWREYDIRSQRQYGEQSEREAKRFFARITGVHQRQWLQRLNLVRQSLAQELGLERAHQRARARAYGEDALQFRGVAAPQVAAQIAAARVARNIAAPTGVGDPFRGLQTNTEMLERSFEHIERRVGAFQRGFRRLAYDVGAGGTAFSGLETRLDIASMSMWKFTIAAMPLRNFGYAVGTVAAGLGLLVANLTKAGAWLDVTRRQFQNMTGTVALANRNIQWLRDQAPKIVYSLQEVVEAGRILTSAGYDIQSVIYPMADLAAGLNQQGIGIVEATRAFVDGMHGEIRRLKNTFNISQQDIIKFTKATTWAMFQQLSAAERQAAILSAIQEKYPEANKAALESVLGAWSDFKDQIIQLSQEIGKQLLGPVKWLVDRIRGIVHWLVNLSEGWKKAIGWTTLGIAALTGIASVTALVVAAAISLRGLVVGIQIWRATGRGTLKEMIKLHLEYAAVMQQVAKTELALRAQQLAVTKLQVKAMEEMNAAAVVQAGTPRAAGVAAARAKYGITGGQAAEAAALGAGGAGAAAAGAGGIGMVLSRVFVPLTIAVGAYLAMKAWATYAERKAIEKLVASTEKAADAIEKSTVVEIPEATKSLIASLRRERELWMQVPGEMRGREKLIGALKKAGATPAEAESMVTAAERERERMGPLGMRELFVPTAEPGVIGGPPPTLFEPRPLREIAVGYGVGAERTEGFLTRLLDELTAEYMGDIEEANEKALESIEDRLGETGRLLHDEEQILENLDAQRRQVAQLTGLTEQQRRDRRTTLDQEREIHAKKVEQLRLDDAELRAIQALHDPAEQLKRYDQGRLDTAKQQAVPMETMLQLMEDMEKKDADRLSLLSKAREAYGTTENALRTILTIQSHMDVYDQKGKQSRQQTVTQLQRQLGLLQSMADAVAAAYRLAEMEPWSKVFAAAGGAEGVGAGVAARVEWAKAGALFAAAGQAQEPAERSRLEREGASALESSLRNQAALRRQMREYLIGEAELEGNAVVRAGKAGDEYGRQAREQAGLWRQQEVALRRMGATEDAVAAARAMHEQEIAKLLKEQIDSYRAMIAAQVESREATQSYAGLWGATVADTVASSRQLARLHRQAAQLALAQGDITAAINEERLAREALLQPEQKALSIAEARLQLAEDLADRGLVGERQIHSFRMAAAGEAYKALQQYGAKGLLNTEEGIAAYRRYIDLLYGGVDRMKKGAEEARDRFKGLIDQVIGAPQGLIQKYLSPAALSRFFGGVNMQGLLGGPEGPSRVPEVYVHNVIRIEGLPQNLVRVVDTRIQQSWRAALPALRTA